MKLKSYTTVQLIAELISRNKVVDSPRSTSYGYGMRIIDIGLGKDEIATISIHDNGIEYLKNYGGSPAARVLRNKGSSKAAKTARGSALSQ
jgi:hypothetical protein